MLELEAANLANFINEGQVSSQKSAQELSRLSTYPCCVLPWQEHYDLHDTPHIDNVRIPLPSARKTEVAQISSYFGVPFSDAV